MKKARSAIKRLILLAMLAAFMGIAGGCVSDQGFVSEQLVGYRLANRIGATVELNDSGGQGWFIESYRLENKRISSWQDLGIDKMPFLDQIELIDVGINADNSTQFTFKYYVLDHPAARRIEADSVDVGDLDYLIGVEVAERSNLMHLSLISCDINDRELWLLCEYLSKSSPSLEVLNVFGNDSITEGGWNRVAGKYRFKIISSWGEK